MTNLNRDFRDILSFFNAESVEYLVVGGYALAAHGLPRATSDIALWTNPTALNAPRVYRALTAFGAPVDRFTLSDFESGDLILQIGLPPSRVDVITSIAGVSFENAWPNRVTVKLDGMTVTVLGKADLMLNKRTVGRPQDRADVARLEKQAQKHAEPS
ncbi:MAG: hypothetical protein ABJC26_02410 [Gemmatimonadaceae bacterium]